MKWLRLLLPFVLCVAVGVATAHHKAFAQQNTDCTAESWLGVGGGIPGNAAAGTVMNNDLYVLQTNLGIQAPNPGDSTYRISKWDGSAWTVVSTFSVRYQPMYVANRVAALTAFNGELYLGGSFTSINGVAGTNGLAKWDGSAWTSVNGGIAGAVDVSAIGEHNGKLHVAYGEVPLRGVRYQIAALNGTAWDKFGGLTNDYGTIHGITSWNGDLYINGRFSSMDGKTTGCVAKWDGSAWAGVGSMSGVAQHVVIYKNDLLVLGQWLTAGGFSNQQGYRWTGSAWANLGTIYKTMLNVTDAEVHNNQLYLIATDDSAFIDPQLFGTNVVRRFDGTTWSTVSNFDNTAAFLVEHNSYLYAGGSFTTSCGNQVAHVAHLCDDQTCSRISGNIFWDRDGNCQKGTNEPAVSNRIVEILPGPQYANTDKDGNYSLFVVPGTYTVGMVPFLHWNQICPSGTHTATLTGVGGSVSGLDFATQPVPNVRDLRVSLSTGRARSGRTLVYALTYSNVGTVTMDGTVSFFYDPRLTFDSASTPPTNLSSPMAQWAFTNLEMGESRTIIIYTTVPRLAAIGDNFCAAVMIDPQVEQMEHDNRDTTCVPVTGGYDPNDIRVSPAGMEDNGEITSRDSVLSYHVRFQNTGNDTAFKVVVVDTLPGTLDPTSIMLGASSHPYQFAVAGKGILTWTFDNIMLPDSGANEPNSNGFFKFSVKLLPNLPVGTQIPNRVSIYFDYNAPVPTNTVISVISGSSGVTPAAAASLFSIFPNPAHGMFYLDAQMSAGARVVVSDMLGRGVRSYSYDGSGRMELNVSDLPAGAYLLSIPTTNGMRVERVTVVR